MTASEAKANQNRIVSSGFELGWWYGTGCRKCCGVYPKFMTKDTQNPRNAYYQCEVCGRRTDLYTMPWLAEKAWNNEFKEEKKMIKIEVETIEELFNIIGGGRPLTVSAPKAKSDPEKDALADENVKLANEVKKYKELLKLATDKADKLQAELDALKAAPVKAEEPATVEEVMPEPQGESVPMDVAPDPEPAAVPEPEIQLPDMRKAVRELVKAKGRDAAKDVLARFGAKGASSLKPEDYPAALAALKEALNG